MKTMYYHMKKMQVTNDGKVFITAADSNISPRQYIEAEYAPKEKDLKAKLSALFQDMLEGNIRPEGSFTKDIQNTLFTVRDYISRYAPEVSYDDDRAFGTNRYNEMNRLVSEMIGPPALLGENIPFEALAKELKHFNAETINIYNDMEERYRNEEIYVVTSASMSMVFPGYDVLYRPENNECIICRRENYDNHGHLDNSDHSAIFLGKGSGEAFYCLCDTVGEEPNGPEINWELLSDIPMAKLPYKGFNPEDYNMILTPEFEEKLRSPITEEMVAEAYKKGIVRIDEAEKFLGDGICAVIENNWFYFAGPAGENISPDDYKKAIPEKDIVHEIYDALCGIKDLDEDEYEYYRLVFKENGVGEKSLNRQPEKTVPQKGKTR